MKHDRLPSFYQIQIDALIELGADEWHPLKAVKACIERRIERMDREASDKGFAGAVKSQRTRLPAC